ncbi:hypothetical protein LS684_02520 [Cytobacillus spongiae]|uniref:hypothetical protein n=1 Tax=Cytobacillus spongiae TaxID=2901381 RepID=UPI001F2823A0|nr:hypothetical protein [Cytobacillus spongiae]UII56380.1 hypothetical protein LS684_02520 [Cytobacillus spongiae]
MKRLSILFICSISIFLFLTGCSKNQSVDQPSLKSGILDEEYVGDAHIVLEQNYRQTEQEAKLQAEVLKKLREALPFESDGLGGHY